MTYPLKQQVRVNKSVEMLSICRGRINIFSVYIGWIATTIAPLGLVINKYI